MTRGHLRQNWPTLLRPAHLVDDTGRVAGFECEPLDRELARELAPALRHALLRSLPGAAIVCVLARLGAVPAPQTWTRARAQPLTARDHGLYGDPRHHRRLDLDLWMEQRAGMQLASHAAHRRPSGAIAVDAFFTPVVRADCFCTRPAVGA